jgi:hypothetical protein
VQHHLVRNFEEPQVCAAQTRMCLRSDVRC